MYARLRRRFRAAGGVGAEFRATNGILQGCPLSVALLNASVAVWARAVEAQAQGAAAEAYADDAYATATSEKPVQAAFAVTGDYGRLTNGKLHVTKSCTFGTVKWVVDAGAAALPFRTELTCVGAPISCRVGRRPGPLEARMRDAVPAAQRVGAAPLPFDARAEACATKVLAAAMYGCTVHQVAKWNEDRLRSTVATAVWGKKHRTRCAELVFTLAGKGHRLDPPQIAACQRVMTLRRMLLRRPELTEHLRRALDAYRRREERAARHAGKLPAKPAAKPAAKAAPTKPAAKPMATPRAAAAAAARPAAAQPPPPATTVAQY
eukprot:gene19739-biopygen1284